MVSEKARDSIPNGDVPQRCLSTLTWCWGLLSIRISLCRRTKRRATLFLQRSSLIRFKWLLLSFFVYKLRNDRNVSRRRWGLRFSTFIIDAHLAIFCIESIRRISLLFRHSVVMNLLPSRPNIFSSLVVRWWRVVSSALNAGTLFLTHDHFASTVSRIQVDDTSLRLTEDPFPCFTLLATALDDSNVTIVEVFCTWNLLL